MSSSSSVQLALDAVRISRAAVPTFLDEAPPEEQSKMSALYTWREYEKPSDPNNLEECERVDAENAKAWNECNRMLTKSVSVFLKRIGVPEPSLKPPRSYVSCLQETVFSAAQTNHCFRTVAATVYLRDELEWRAFEDYDPEQACEVAQSHALQRLIDLQRSNPNGIDLPDPHASYCGCNRNKWDGRSRTCDGGTYAVSWQRPANHDFLRPKSAIKLTTVSKWGGAFE